MDNWAAALLAGLSVTVGICVGRYWRMQNWLERYMDRLDRTAAVIKTFEVEREVREWNNHAINIMMERGHLNPDTANQVRIELARMATRQSLS